MRHTPRILAKATLITGLMVGPAAAQSSPEAQPVRATTEAGEVETVEGFAQPYQQVTLGPVTAGRIAKLTVSEGQAVKQGTLLLSLDDGVQQTRTLLAKLEAESNVDIELAKARLRGAERELDRVRDLHRRDAASKKELEDSELLVEVRRLEVLKAEFENRQAQHRYELERLKLAELRVQAPFDGVVTELIKRTGEQVDEREAVLAMVQLDPLEVVVDCPMDLASKVRLGGTARIQPVDDPSAARSGTVTVASRAGDAASQTFRVKLKVPNADGGWISGRKVRVTFLPDTTAGATSNEQGSRSVCRSD